MFRYSTGAFVRHDNGTWVEQRNSGINSTFRFAGSTAEFVELFDASRNMFVRLYADKGMVRNNATGQWFMWPGSNGTWVR